MSLHRAVNGPSDSLFHRAWLGSLANAFAAATEGTLRSDSPEFVIMMLCASSVAARPLLDAVSAAVIAF